MDGAEPKQTYTLEQRLFHAIHDNHVHAPSVKEFKECFAFQNIVRSAFSRPKRVTWDVVIDVAGGHGALGALFLICTPATYSVVIDPAQVGSGGVELAWGKFFGHHKRLHFRHECLRTGLHEELKEALARGTRANRILVVACHACQHLSEETLQIASTYGVHAAVMPCCQKDMSPGSTWKEVGKRMSLSVGNLMDLLLAGKMMASGRYDVRMKLMDPSITPQNRIIICRALSVDAMDQQKAAVEVAHAKLQTAYQKAHKAIPVKSSNQRRIESGQTLRPVLYLSVGFLAGAILSSWWRSVRS